MNFSNLPVKTWWNFTIIRIRDTVLALVAQSTVTGVGSIGIPTSSAVPTRRWDGTLINIIITVTTRIAQLTITWKVQEVTGRRTIGSIPTLAWTTGIQFVLTSRPSPGKATHALVPIHNVNTGTTVLTRSGCWGTFINVNLTVETRVTRLTSTGVGVEEIRTHPLMLTGITLALIRFEFTSFSCQVTNIQKSIKNLPI